MNWKTQRHGISATVILPTDILSTNHIYNLKHIRHSFVRYLVHPTSDQMTIDDINSWWNDLDKITIDKMTLDEMTVYKMKVDELTRLNNRRQNTCRWNDS